MSLQIYQQLQKKVGFSEKLKRTLSESIILQYHHMSTYQNHSTPSTTTTSTSSLDYIDDNNNSGFEYEFSNIPKISTKKKERWLQKL